MKIISRAEWGATDWRTPLPYVDLDERTGVYMHYHGGAVSQQYGVAVPRNVERIHLANGWRGTGYNFMVDMAGVAYEGAGWTGRGSHSPYHNRDGFGIYLAIGGSQKPTEAALATARWLYDEACRKTGKSLYKRYHNWDYATACPGPFLVNWVNSGMPAKAVGGSAPLPATSKDWFDLATIDELRQALNDVLWSPVVTKAPNETQAAFEAKVPGLLRSSWRNNVWHLQMQIDSMDNRMAKLESLIIALAEKQLDPADFRAAAEAGAKAAIDSKIQDADVVLNVGA